MSTLVAVVHVLKRLQVQAPHVESVYDQSAR